MKEVFRHSDAGLVSVYKTLLESAEIQTFVRNADTQQTLVSDPLVAIFPLPDFWPTLCVVNDEDYPAAMDILREGNDLAAGTKAEWTCTKCGETVPDHFSNCWNCGHSANR